MSKIFESKIFLLSSFVLVSLLGYAHWSYFQKDVELELEKKKHDLQESRSTSQELLNLKEYLASKIYLERAARRRLQLVKPGEKVMIVVKNEESVEVAPAEERKNRWQLFKEWVGW